MPIKFVVLWTDALLYLLFAGVFIFVLWVRRREHLRAPWRQVAGRRLGMVALVILSCYVLVGFLDSIHFRVIESNGQNGQVYYSGELQSVLDVLMAPRGDRDESTYSAPFATHSYAKAMTRTADGVERRTYPLLTFGGQHLDHPDYRASDIVWMSAWALIKSCVVWAVFTAVFVWIVAKRASLSWRQSFAAIWRGGTAVAWREFLITLGAILAVTWLALALSAHYHIMGTDKVGKDIFYEAVKSIRTGLVIGTVTTLVMLPFALLLGTMAGYFGGRIDDIIQYVYTTLSSVPGVLLISAAILALQVFIANHVDMFPTIAERADARLLALCLILGVTSWTGLCRLLRAETLKVREMDYVRAALSMGVGRFKIILRHILPNVMHIVLITVVLDFSGLVLAEAVLSYVGVGVDPTTLSWGNMINSSRLDLAREPVVWWPLLAAFVFMFILVLSANLFADAVRDAFDPRLRHTE